MKTMYQADNLTMQQPLFGFISAYSTFSAKRAVWNAYLKYAIPSMENATKQMEENLYTIPGLPPAQAKKEHKLVSIVTSQLEKARKPIEKETAKDFLKFKTAVLNLFAMFEQVEAALKTAANQKDSARAAFHTKIQTQKNFMFERHLTDV